MPTQYKEPIPDEANQVNNAGTMGTFSGEAEVQLKLLIILLMLITETNITCVLLLMEIQTVT